MVSGAPVASLKSKSVLTTILINEILEFQYTLASRSYSLSTLQSTLVITHWDPLSMIPIAQQV
jgi:hypothetical protein